MGQESKLKARVGGREERQAPPTDSGTARSSGNQPGKPPQRAPTPQVQPVPLPAQARGCKGRSPLHKKTKNLPLPAGKGAGGMGAEKQTKGRVGGRQRKQATRWHWLPPPRGRGPSQTPKFLSPGPPSPWLPALLIGKCFCRFCGELAMPKARPCRMPDWQVEPVSPGQAPQRAPAWQVL